MTRVKNQSATVVSVTGSSVAEVLTDADAVANVLTFAANIEAIEIWHNETGLEEFIVNGLTLSVGPGGWSRPIGGTPAATVTIPAATTCAVSRLT